MGSTLPPLDTDITVLKRELHRALIKFLILFVVGILAAAGFATAVMQVLTYFHLSTEWTGNGAVPACVATIAILFPIYTKYWRFRFRTLNTMRMIKRSITVPEPVDNTTQPTE